MTVGKDTGPILGNAIILDMTTAPCLAECGTGNNNTQVCRWGTGKGVAGQALSSKNH